MSVLLPSTRATIFALSCLLCGSLAQAFELRIPPHPGSDQACSRIWKRLGALLPNLQLRVTGDHVTAARRDLSLLEGSLDADCGTIRTPPGSGLRYSAVPVYSVRVVLVARLEDDIAIHNAAELRTASEATPLLLNRGSQFRALVEKLGVKAIDDSGAHTQQNIQKLLAGHGRLFLYQQPALDSKLRESGLQGRVRVLAWSPGKVAYYMAYSPHMDRTLVERLDTALQQLAHKGELGTPKAAED